MENKKILKFDLDPSQIKIKDLLNKQFLDIEIEAISDANPNRNNSHFTKESMEKAIPSVKNKPVLGAFGKGKLNGPNDFDEHNADIKYDMELGQAYWDYENGERILGTVRESDYVGVEEKNGQNWLVFRCCLWTLYNYKAVKNLLKSKKKRVSVEVVVTKSYYDERNVEIIEEFELLGVTILGDKTLEGIPGAHLTILEKLENALFKKNVECLQFAYKSLEEINNNDSNLENDSNLHNNENDAIEKGGDAMLTAEQKRSLLEAAVADKFNDEENCCWAYVCDYTDSDVYVCMNGGEYCRYPYSISDSNEVLINAEEGVRVVRDWKEFSTEDEEMACKKDMDEDEPSEEDPKKEDEPSEEEPSEEEPEQEDEACEMENNEKCHSADFSNEDKDNADAEDYPIDIDGKTYSVQELKDAYIEMSNQYNAIKNELDELKEEKFKQECEKMYSTSCEMFDTEDEFDDSDSEYIIGMKAQIKEKCENKEFKTIDECINFTEDNIAKYIYQKRKESKKNNKSNEEKNFSVDIPAANNNSNKRKDAKDILKNYVNS